MKTINVHTVDDILLAERILDGVRTKEGKLTLEVCPYCGERLRETLKAVLITNQGVQRHIHCDSCDYRNVETIDKEY